MHEHVQAYGCAQRESNTNLVFSSKNMNAWGFVYVGVGQPATGACCIKTCGLPCLMMTYPRLSPVQEQADLGAMPNI